MGLNLTAGLDKHTDRSLIPVSTAFELGLTLQIYTGDLRHRLSKQRKSENLWFETLFELKSY